MPGSRVSALVEDFQLESSYDWWTAGHGIDYNNTATLLVKLSGDLSITRVMSPANTMWIEFKSDSRVAKAGFWLYLQAVVGQGKFWIFHVDEAGHEIVILWTLL